MNYSMRSSRTRTRLRHALAVSGILCSLLAGARTVRAQEFFTEWEIEKIRDAQEVDLRVPVFLLIAQNRLIQLGVAEGEIESNEAGGPNKALTFMVGIFQPNIAAEMERVAEEAKREAEFENDLTRFGPAELLGGYYQALDEAMDAIDDAYERRVGDLRPALASLRDYAVSTLPLLRAYQTEDGDTEAALAEAVEQAETARDGAIRALELIPKTERDQ